MNRRKTLCWAHVDLIALNFIAQVALRAVVCLVHAHSNIGVVARFDGDAGPEDAGMGMQACLIAIVYSQRLGSAGLLNTFRAFAAFAAPLAYFCRQIRQLVGEAAATSIIFYHDIDADIADRRVS
jgi:hypothetical protein